MSRVLIFVCILSASVFGQNVLNNGDFESGIVKGHFATAYPQGWQGWGQNGWHHSDSGYRRGSYGIAIWSNDTGCYQSFNAVSGQEFDVSCEMIYHDGDVLKNKNALLKIEFRNGSRLLPGTIVWAMTPTHPAKTWKSFSATVTAPSGATEGRVVCMTKSTGGVSSGKAYWDNIIVNTGPTINEPDYNGDNKVNFFDFEKLASVWNQQSKAYNLTGDNFIGLEDLDILANEWLCSATLPLGYELVWSDEFDGVAIDTNNWTHEVGGGGWGNNERQYYSNHLDNSYISNGNLVMVARKNHLNHDYTSARLTTKHKKSFMYGRMEARVKLPQGGQGIWPAFWMMGNNISTMGWPECGEIDILESVNDPTEIHGVLHYGSGDPYIHNQNGGVHDPGFDASDDYHVYAIEWEPTRIRWYFDEVNYYTSSNWWSSSEYPAPYNQQFFFILNIAVGGNWPGYPNASTPFPQHMYVDYVRVYQTQDK